MGEPFFRPVVKLGGARALVRGHFLRKLERAAVREVSGNPRGAERVVANFAAMPAAAVRRRIIRQASGWLIALSESTVPLCPRAVRNRKPLRSSAMLAALI